MFGLSLNEEYEEMLMLCFVMQCSNVMMMRDAEENFPLGSR